MGNLLLGFLFNKKPWEISWIFCCLAQVMISQKIELEIESNYLESTYGITFGVFFFSKKKGDPRKSFHQMLGSGEPRVTKAKKILEKIEGNRLNFCVNLIGFPK